MSGRETPGPTDVTLPDEALHGFSTDTPIDEPDADGSPAREELLEEPVAGGAIASFGDRAAAGEASPSASRDEAVALAQASALSEGSTLAALPLLSALDVRPAPSRPREYRFPPFERRTLANGMELVTADVRGRALLTAQLLVRGDAGGGVSTEPAELSGETVIMARALVEGTRNRDAVEVVEASERLGAELSADAGWDSLAAGVEVPRTRLVPALSLLAEVALEPSFPESEVNRLRDERLNDLLQARADPRRRSERVFPEQVYAPASPYVRPLGGVEESVARITRDSVAARHAQMVRPSASTLLISGDLSGVDVEAAALEAFARWPATDPAPVVAPPETLPRTGAPRVLVVDRPGSPQTEVRIGHIGLPRLIADFHAISVMNSILGGLFNSRLNQLLREQRGYTYGIHSGFDFRRGAGPFVVRTAVQAEVTVPAVQDILGELRRLVDDPPSEDELRLARDYLIGVFPLRFETAGQVAAALGGIVIFGMPDDELDQYRPAIEAVTRDDVAAAARAHVRPDEAAIVLVGDADVILPPLEGAGLGDVEVVRERATAEPA